MKLSTVKYVGIYAKTERRIEVNLWIAENKHLKIYRFSHREDALYAAYELVKTFNVFIYAAAPHQKGVYLDMNAFQQKFEQKVLQEPS